MDLKPFVTDVPDFPKPGIIFRDISPLLREHFRETVVAMTKLFSKDEWASFDVVGGIESRGFILGAALALVHGKGFVKIRKAGKLPGAVERREYEMEYGEGALEMQHGQGRMLIIDDVLATGETMKAAAELARAAGYEVGGFGVLINLKSLNNFSWRRRKARAVMHYD